MNSAETIGPQLRAWRMSRRVSQEQLAERAGVSARHLSFVENGRSQPSRDLVLALAGALDVPLRDRNALLTAAGFAAAYRASPLDGGDLAQVRRAIDHVLRQQEPYGAAVVDGGWNILQLNRGAAALVQRFPPTSAAGLEAARNLLLGTVHPDALRRYIVNWQEVALHLVVRLHREIAMRPEDETQRRLLARVLAQPDVPGEWRIPVPGRTAGPVLTVHLKNAGTEVKLFTMLTSIGTPLDVTADEIHIETYFPADDASDAVIRSFG